MTAAQSATRYNGWTEGPWQVFPHYCGTNPDLAGEYARTRLIGLGQFETVAEVRHGSDDIAGDVDANAHLIAAAPCLYEALAELHGACLGTPVGGGDGGTYVVGSPSAASLNKALAALSRARGEA
jgi:hypothetical protein